MSAKKKLFQNQYYSELTPEDARAPKPGAFFYGPVLFEPRIVATVRPVVDPQTGGLRIVGGKALFDIEMPLPPDAFKRTNEVTISGARLMGPHEDLVAIPGKMRPFIVVSPEGANTKAALAAPTFKLANFDDASRDRILNDRSILYFYLPECPELGVLESCVSLERMQRIVWDKALTNPGNRKKDESPSFLRLSDQYFQAFKAKVKSFLDVS